MLVPFARLSTRWCGSGDAGSTAPPKPARKRPAAPRPMKKFAFMGGEHPVRGQREPRSAPGGTLAPSSGASRCRGLLLSNCARSRFEEGRVVPEGIDATGVGLDPRTHSSRETCGHTRASRARTRNAGGPTTAAPPYPEGRASRRANPCRRPPLAFRGMADDSSGEGLRQRLARTSEDALGKLAQDLLENSLVNGALTRAFEAREKAVQAQEVAMGALNLPSAADIERLTRRVRSVSQRLEGIEDGVDRLGERLAGLDEATGLEGRLDAIEEQLRAMAGVLATLSEQTSPPRPPARSRANSRTPAAAESDSAPEPEPVSDATPE